MWFRGTGLVVVPKPGWFQTRLVAGRGTCSWARRGRGESPWGVAGDMRSQRYTVTYTCRPVGVFRTPAEGTDTRDGTHHTLEAGQSAQSGAQRVLSSVLSLSLSSLHNTYRHQLYLAIRGSTNYPLLAIRGCTTPSWRSARRPPAASPPRRGRAWEAARRHARRARPG